MNRLVAGASQRRRPWVRISEVEGKDPQITDSFKVLEKCKRPTFVTKDVQKYDLYCENIQREKTYKIWQTKEKQQLQGMAKQLQVKMAAKRKYRKCRKSRQVAARVHVVYNITPPQRERISLCRLLLCCLLKFSFALCRMNFERK